MVRERARVSGELLHTVLSGTCGERHGGSQSLPCPAVTPLIVPSGLGFSKLGLRAPSPSAQNCCVTSVKNYEIKILLFCLVRNSQGSVCVVSSLQFSWKLSLLSALSPLSPELRTFFHCTRYTYGEHMGLSCQLQLKALTCRALHIFL